MGCLCFAICLRIQEARGLNLDELCGSQTCAIDTLTCNLGKLIGILVQRYLTFWRYFAKANTYALKERKDGENAGLYLNMQKTKVMTTDDIRSFKRENIAIEAVDCYIYIQDLLCLKNEKVTMKLQEQE